MNDSSTAMTTVLRGVSRLIAALFACCLWVGSARAEVGLPSGQYYLNNEDLIVKVMGGTITVRRTWYANAWHFNRAWSPLQFRYDSLDGSIKAIVRNGDEYAKQGDAYAFGRRLTIRRTAEGFRWQDHGGEWIDYDGLGRIQAFGDRNGTRAGFDLDGQGQVLGVRDRIGTQVLWYEYQGNLVQAVRDQTGRRVQYLHASGRLTGWIDVLGNTWSYAYDDSGRLIALTDPDQQTARIAYDTSGRVAGVRDHDGRGADYRYDYDNARREYYTQVRTVGGKLVETWYDFDGMPLRTDVGGQTLRSIRRDGRKLLITNARGNITTIVYDEWDNRVRISYPDGTSERYVYETLHSDLLESVDEGGIRTQYEYDGSGRLVRRIEAVGLPQQRITEYDYDDHGYPITVRHLADASTSMAELRYTYDNRGNLTSARDAEGNLWQFTYDALSNRVSTIDPLGQIWVRDFDQRRRLRTSTNPLGETVRFEYDPLSRLVNATNANGETQAYRYDAGGRVVRITDATGNSSARGYTGDGELSIWTDRLGRRVSFAFDGEGRVRNIEQAGGDSYQIGFEDSDGRGTGGLVASLSLPTRSTVFRYDSRERPIATEERLEGQPDRVARYEFDLAANLSRYIDFEGRATTSRYDALNRLRTFTDPGGDITGFDYDSRDNLIAYTDPGGHTTRFEYDRASRLVRQIHPLGQSMSYRYDPAGRVIERMDSVGQRRSFTYDAAGRLTSEEQFDAAGTKTKTIRFTYDAAGRLSGYDDGSTSANYEYDRTGRKTRETINYGPFSLSYAYTWYPNGLKKSYTSPEGVTQSFTYDDANRLDSVQLPVGGISLGEYQWYAPTRVTLPGGMTQLFRYDPYLRLTGMQSRDAGGSALYTFAASYSKTGNIVSKTIDQEELRFSYDESYRLAQVERAGQLIEQYAHDGSGNRTSDLNRPGIWSYDDNNRLLNAGDTSYQHDANGDLVERRGPGGTLRFIRSVEQRIERVEDGSGQLIARYYYDPYGRRLWKEANDTRTYYLYADEGLVGEYSAAGEPIVAYGYAPAGLWSSDPLFQRRGENYFFYHNDHLGTPQRLTRPDGSLVWSARYASFGAATVAEGSTVTSNWRLPGQYFDAETGLHYNGLRYYDPATGRYLETDPIGLAAGGNLYCYANGNPHAYIDPTGAAIPLVYIAVGALIVVTIAIVQTWWMGSPDARKSLARAITECCVLGKPEIETYPAGDGAPSTGGSGPPPTSAEPAPGYSVPPYAGSPPTKNQPTVYPQADRERPNPGYGPNVPPGINDPVMNEGTGESESPVGRNKRKGDDYEDEIAKDLEAAGRRVDHQVRKETPFGPRIVDLEVSDKDGNVLGGIEVKSGDSRYRSSQRAKDEWLRQNGYPVNVVRQR